MARNFGTDPKWDDLLIPVSATYSGGSNPPEFVLFRDLGIEPEDNYALYFDGGTAFATIPYEDSASASVFDFASSWSLSFWVVIPPGQQNLDRLFYHPQWSISVAPGSRLRVSLDSYADVTSITSYPVGERVHVVLTIEENGGVVEEKLFFNTQTAIDTIFAGSLAADGGADINVGAQASGTRHITMTIDDIRFYDKVLSGTEISALYAGGLGTSETITAGNTISHYKLNENTGVVAADTVYPGATTHEMTLVNTLWLPGLVDAEEASHGVFTHSFSPDIEQELFFTVQLPHAWMEDDDICPHVHWCPSDDQLGSVVWGLEYTWANIGGMFGATNILKVTYGAGGASHKHIMSSFDDIDGSDKTLSSMLVCRVFRAATDEEDTYPGYAYLLEIDFHIRSFVYGSDTESQHYD